MTAPPLFHLHQGSSAVVVSVPHAGTYLPPDIASQLTMAGRGVVDTDWHVDRLCEGVTSLGTTLLVATHSRTVIDLNRAPDDSSLYPGRTTTGLCPTETFDGDLLYADAPPHRADIKRRVEQYWQPYHDALNRALARASEVHGHAVLLDAHSIRAQVPRLFDGVLPDLNFGTFDGASATAALTARALQAVAGSGFSSVLNGRFKGGYITRHYGRAGTGIQALQLEIAQTAYMDEANPHAFDPVRAFGISAVIRRLVAML